jgi:putative membrane protein
MSKLVTLLMAVALVAGCKKDKAEEAPNTTKSAPADASNVATAAADAGGGAATGTGTGTGTAAPAAEKPTDAQIVAIVTVANKGDIAAGELAKSKTKNKDVKSFAEMMIKDHTAMQADGEKAAKAANITPEDNETSKKMQSDADATAAKLKGLEGAEFDKAYADSEVTMHQQVLDALDNVLIPAAQNADLKNVLTAAREKVNGHLEHAKALADKLGAAK